MSLADDKDVINKKGYLVGIISLMKPNLIHFTAGLRIDETFYTYEEMRYCNLLSRSSISLTFCSPEVHSIYQTLVFYFTEKYLMVHFMNPCSRDKVGLFLMIYKS